MKVGAVRTVSHPVRAESPGPPANGAGWFSLHIAAHRSSRPYLRPGHHMLVQENVHNRQRLGLISIGS